MARIQQCYGKLRKLETDLFFQKRQLEYVVSPRHFKAIKAHKDRVQTRMSTLCKERQKKEFDALLSRQTLERQPSDRHIVNLSSRNLSAPQLQALSRGLNFVPSPQFIPKVHIVASVEAAIYRSRSTEEQATKAHVGVVGALNRVKPPPRNTLPEEMRAVKQLAIDKDIVILPADKGRATVVMNQSDYSAKMQAMLDDRDIYQPLSKDPTSSLESKMNRILLKLIEKDRSQTGPMTSYAVLHTGCLTCMGYLRFTSWTPHSGPLFRSCHLQRTYGLSKFLASLLKPLVGLSAHHVRNFAQFIKSQRLSGTEILMSFDVVSLFTYVPTDPAVQVAHEWLENDPSLSQRSSLSVDDICSLLSLCLEATYLVFEGRVYQQFYGTAMGSPVMVVVANLVMEDIEHRALATFHTPPHFWRRYLDDTRDLVDPFHEHLNSIDPHIQFTVERESGGKLLFLDVLLTREEDGTIRTEVYRNPTHTDQYLACDSHHPVAHKRAVVIFNLFNFSRLLHIFRSHITTCLHLYLYSSACTFVNY